MRQGLTQEVMIDENLNMVSLLHCLLRIFDFTTKLMGFLCAEIFVWSESQLVLGRSFAFLEKAKADIKEVVLARTGIPINAADPTGKEGNANKKIQHSDF